MMNTDFRELANGFIRQLTPYQPGKPLEELQRELGIEDAIKLASNESPLGASHVALAAGYSALNNAHIYPDGACFELKRALANFLQVKPEQLTMGNGSENVLELIIKSYLHAGDHAVISQYAFLTIPLLLQSYGTHVSVTPAKEYGHDTQALLAAITDKTRVIFLVNPNNPTGTYTTTAEFEAFMRQVPKHIVVVVDEAYSEYIEAEDYPNTLSYLPHYPNLIITRTFSKVYGLAAVRLGFSISSPEIADILNRSRLPFNVNSIAAAMGIAALSDQEHVKKTVALNRLGLIELEQGLTALNIPFIPSICNFVTVDVGDGKAIYETLLQAGVIVRPLHAYGMPRHIRVTTGTSVQNQRFLTTLGRIKESGIL